MVNPVKALCLEHDAKLALEKCYKTTLDKRWCSILKCVLIVCFISSFRALGNLNFIPKLRKNKKIKRIRKIRKI